MAGERERTLQELAKEAMEIQDACNLHGLVQGWARSVKELKKLLEAAGIGGTDQINQHPINKLWADKLADLSKSRNTVDHMVAFDRVTRLMNGEPCDVMGVAPTTDEVRLPEYR